MNDEELRDMVFQKFQEWINKNFYDRSGLLNTIGSPDWDARYKSFMSECGIKWDEYLNRLDIRRIEHHLERNPRRGHIRIRDPFMLGPNRRRDLEMTADTARKIVVLGMP